MSAGVQSLLQYTTGLRDATGPKQLAVRQDTPPKHTCTNAVDQNIIDKKKVRTESENNTHAKLLVRVSLGEFQELSWQASIIHRGRTQGAWNVDPI